MCFIVSFLLLCCKHVVDISHFVLYFILCDMYVLPIGAIKKNYNKFLVSAFLIKIFGVGDLPVLKSVIE